MSRALWEPRCRIDAKDNQPGLCIYFELVSNLKQFTHRTRRPLVMAIPTPVQEALRDSITSGTFIDTKFWVFSKRNSKVGRVGEPKALFVNAHVVRSVPQLGARTFVLSDHKGCLSD
jgi:hypothetical protein